MSTLDGSDDPTQALSHKLASQRARTDTAETARNAVALAVEIFQHFTERGHPGGPCVRTGWVNVETFQSWWEALSTIRGDDPAPRKPIAPAPTDRPLWRHSRELGDVDA